MRLCFHRAWHRAWGLGFGVNYWYWYDGEIAGTQECWYTRMLAPGYRTKEKSAT